MPCLTFRCQAAWLSAQHPQLLVLMLHNFIPLLLISLKHRDGRTEVRETSDNSVKEILGTEACIHSAWPSCHRWPPLRMRNTLFVFTHSTLSLLGTQACPWMCRICQSHRRWKLLSSPRVLHWWSMLCCCRRKCWAHSAGGHTVWSFPWEWNWTTLSGWVWPYLLLS